MPEGYKPRIINYWLLGFVEGKGSFNVNKGYYLTFIFTESSIDFMEAIKYFLNNLPGVK